MSLEVPSSVFCKENSEGRLHESSGGGRTEELGSSCFIYVMHLSLSFLISLSIFLFFCFSFHISPSTNGKRYFVHLAIQIKITVGHFILIVQLKFMNLPWCKLARFVSPKTFLPLIPNAAAYFKYGFMGEIFCGLHLDENRFGSKKNWDTF